MMNYGRLGRGLAVWFLAASVCLAGEKLQVGASRIDITPPPSDLPLPYNNVHDKIYVRTILLDDGGAKAAIVVVDVPMVEGGMYREIVAQVSRQAACPEANVVLAITHAHNSIRMDTSGVGKTIPFSLAFNAKVKEAIGQSIAEAKAKVQPARAGFGRGESYIAANRNEWSEKDQRYVTGVDRTGQEPFDPTLSVFKFENMAGEPIAFLVNYGIEPVVYNASRADISGDVPGAVSHYVEERYGGKAVVAFTVGAAGNPAYHAGARAPGRVRPSTAHDILSAMGTLVGEEVMAVSDGIHNATDELSIVAALKTVTCAGKITTPLNLPNSCAYNADSKLPPCRDYRDQDAEPVELRVGILRIGDVAFVHADANVAPKLEMRLMKESPLTNTVFASLNFGPAWFVVDDASYPLNTYEATASRLKRGCGERGFINAALQMLR
jgi:hypothetical protein